MIIARQADTLFAHLRSSPKITLILGARQVGKTTLVANALANTSTTFLNLDIDADKQRLLAAAALPPADALRALDSPDTLVIDEAQRLPETARIAKGWYDVQLPVKIVLLGSSSLDLSSQAAESLVGRNEKLRLPPLLFREIFAAQSWYSDAFDDPHLLAHFPDQIASLLLTSLAYGHYPEAVTTADKEGYLRNLVADYLWKDVLQLGLVRNPQIIRRLLTLLAHQVGSEVSVSELATNLGASRATIDRYLDLLEATFVIFRLPAFGTNPRKEISKNQKVFFWDTGVRNALINEMTPNPLRPDIGALWENWVIAECAKQNLLAGERKNLYFWRPHQGAEVDLVVKEGETLQAYEVKWNKKRPSSRAFSNRYGGEIKIINSQNPLFQL